MMKFEKYTIFIDSVDITYIVILNLFSDLIN